MENNLPIISDYFDLNQSFREINEILSLIPNQTLSSALKEAADKLIDDFCDTDIKELRFPVTKSYLAPKIDKLFSNYSSFAEFSLLVAHFLSNSEKVKSKFTLKYDKYASIEDIKKEFSSLSPYISTETASTLEFSKFTKRLAEWHIGVEMTVFYFNLVRYLLESPKEIAGLSEDLAGFEFEISFLDQIKEESLKLFSDILKQIDWHANILRISSAFIMLFSCLLNTSPYSVCLEQATIFIFGPTVFKYIPNSVYRKIDDYLSKSSFNQLSSDIEEQSYKAICLEETLLDLTKLIVVEKGKIPLSQNKKEIIYNRAKKIGKYFEEVTKSLENADKEVKEMIMSDVLKYEETRVKDFNHSFMLINKEK